LLREKTVVGAIPYNVTLKLGPPEFAVSPGQLRSGTFMLMPKTAIDEENRPPFWKCQVWAAGQIVAKETISKP
jgi:hypothetical protein